MKNACNCITWGEVLPLIFVLVALCGVAGALGFTILRNRAQKEGGV